MHTTEHPLAVYYEHPTWFGPLFAELERRAIPHVKLHAARHEYDPAESAVPYALVLNRASPSAYLRGHRTATFHTLHWLHHVERRGVPVVNGSRPYALEISKAAQIGLLAALDLPHPRSRAINDASQAVPAAAAIGYPVIVKPNVGGSGAGIVRFDTEGELAAAQAGDGLDLGPDGVALVQQCLPLAEERITRVEVLDGRVLYAIHVYPGDSFNLCPADACRSADGRALTRSACPADAPDSGMRVEPAEPPAAILEQVTRIARAARLDVGGIEYLVDRRTGRHCFYDINALSNFVADAPRLLGFDPTARLVDYLERRLGVLQEA